MTLTQTRAPQPRVSRATAASAEIRRKRTGFFSELRSLDRSQGAALVAVALEDHQEDPLIGGLFLTKLLRGIITVGPHQAEMFLRAANLTRNCHHRRVRELTPSERLRVARALRTWSGG